MSVDASSPDSLRSRWRFSLKTADGQVHLAADDEEEETEPGRLDLLAVVRGLEALDQPSRVTLVTASRYVQRGLRYGLDQWRENAWRWESYGEMIPIRNHDLWRRLDQALRFHDVECRHWRFDPPQASRGPRPRSRAWASAEAAENVRSEQSPEAAAGRASLPLRLLRASVRRFAQWFRSPANDRSAWPRAA